MRSKAILRTAAVTLVDGLSITAAASPATAEHPERLRPFAAKHDDGCTYVSTSGDLAWKAWHAPDTPGVNVWGEVGARQRPDCAYVVPVTPFADFTAYIEDRVVDHQVVAVGERNPTEFHVLLEPTDGGSVVAEIDRVEVRACLVSSVISPPPGEREEIPDAWCGKPDVHHRLVFEPTGS